MRTRHIIIALQPLLLSFCLIAWLIGMRVEPTFFQLVLSSIILIGQINVFNVHTQTCFIVHVMSFWVTVNNCACSEYSF